MQSCCLELFATPATIIIDLFFDYLTTEQQQGGNVHSKKLQKTVSLDIFFATITGAAHFAAHFFFR
jgi:hypothetical protein